MGQGQRKQMLMTWGPYQSRQRGAKTHFSRL